MKRLLLTLLAALLLLAPLYARSFLEARAELQSAQSLLQSHNYSAAVPHLRRAAAWNSPLNSYSQDAAARLRALGFDRAVPAAIRLQALKELESALRSSRNILKPAAGTTQDGLPSVRKEIENLSSAVAPAAVSLAERIPDPRYEYQLLAQVSFWLWIAAVLWTIFRGFTPEGLPIRRALLRGTGVWAACYLVWLLALSQA